MRLLVFSFGGVGFRLTFCFGIFWGGCWVSFNFSYSYDSGGKDLRNFYKDIFHVFLWLKWERGCIGHLKMIL